MAVSVIAKRNGWSTVTVMGSAMGRPDRLVTMTVDHPFLFAITDTVTGLPLFLGQVTRPKAG